MTLVRRRFTVSLLAAVALTSTASAQSRRFFPDDPIWREPITQDVKHANRYEPDLAYQILENLFLSLIHI